MVLARADLEVLKQLMGTGERGRNVSELGPRVTLDRLAKGGFVVARPIGVESYKKNDRSATSGPIENPRGRELSALNLSEQQDHAGDAPAHRWILLHAVRCEVTA